MWRLPIADTDNELIHLWRNDPPTVTECGITAEARPGSGLFVCVECVKAYGAELAEEFHSLEWLRSVLGMTRHAFEPEALKPDAFDRHGRVRPVCDMRSYLPGDLTPDSFVQRCPGCISHLEVRRTTT
jgi:hypothetical protein